MIKALLKNYKLCYKFTMQIFHFSFLLVYYAIVGVTVDNGQTVEEAESTSLQSDMMPKGYSHFFSFKDTVTLIVDPTFVSLQHFPVCGVYQMHLP